MDRKYRSVVKRYCYGLVRTTAQWIIGQVKRQSFNISSVSILGIGWVALCAMFVKTIDQTGTTIMAGYWPTEPQTAIHVLWWSVLAIAGVGLVGLVGIAVLVKKVFGYGRETRSIRQLFGESLLGGLFGTGCFILYSLLIAIWSLYLYQAVSSPTKILPDGGLIVWALSMVIAGVVIFGGADLMFWSMFVDDDQATAR